MAKISIDIDNVKESLINIGYEISDCIERNNNGLNWQLKFHNSGAIVTVYDTNTKKNTVVNGKFETGEKENLKEIVDGLKCKEISISSLNSVIVSYINSKQEACHYDFKQEWHSASKDADLLHDILCLANNTDNADAYLIIGVTDSYDVVGVTDWKKSNEVFDYLRSKKFAGSRMPEIQIHKLYYKHRKIDVVEIKSSKNVPFYLAEKYRDVGVQIYTRVGDTNTPKNECANYNDVEALWRIHFEREKE
ncbi:MAG: ATP-binding protein [Ruminococcaceae bacterium]|nr:ATP-binding protein [Oscillospiraceae bacterium]